MPLIEREDKREQEPLRIRLQPGVAEQLKEYCKLQSAQLKWLAEIATTSPVLAKKTATMRMRIAILVSIILIIAAFTCFREPQRSHLML